MTPPSLRSGFYVAIASLTAVAVVLAFSWRSPALRRHARAFDRRLRGRDAHFVDHVVADHFQRGNVHTHSTLSDGTAPLEAMVGWYRSLGYQFLAMTEHNLQIESSRLDGFAAPGFVVIPGEEVTNHWGERGGHPLHVNALCAGDETRGGVDFARPEVGLAATLDDVRGQGGIPLVNHPNFQWTLTADDIARGTSGRYLFEVWSGHPSVNPEGDALHPSAEAIWDELLARGADAIPVAVDDAHALPPEAGIASSRGGAVPGRGWVETFGDVTSADAICAALAAGRLYASNGPVLARIAVQGDTFVVGTTDDDARVTFLGERGEILARMRAREAPTAANAREITYRLSGGERFVRARVEDLAGRRAWTAAYQVGD